MYKYKLTEQTDEEGALQKFHNERIAGFDKVNDLFGQLKPLLEDAKNKTIQYYKQHPESFEILYGSDLACDYINDIIKMFKTK